MSNDTAFPSNLMHDKASPVLFNKADNAWQLTATTLVGLQSIPGVMISIWWRREENMAGEFSIYEANVALNQNYLLEQAFLGKFPNGVFRSVFAAITLALIAGVVLGRMDFYAWIMFVPLWLTFSYTFTAFNVWYSAGFLAKMGLIDYSGGYVIHLSSGVAGYIAAYGGRATIIMGLCSGSIPWTTMMAIHKISVLLQKVDDTMVVLHTHAIASSLGGILIGVFFEASACYIGLFYGFDDKSRIGSGVRQIGVQFIGILFVVVGNVLTDGE